MFSLSFKDHGQNAWTEWIDWKKKIDTHFNFEELSHYQVNFGQAHLKLSVNAYKDYTEVPVV